jgi:hypothetical protein
MEQGYQASEVASFCRCHASDVSRTLQKRETSFEQESQVGPEFSTQSVTLIRR